MLMMGIWWQENKNKLVEWKALVDIVGIKSADLEDEFGRWIFVQVFYDFTNCQDVKKGHKLPYVVMNNKED